MLRNKLGVAGEIQHNLVPKDDTDGKGSLVKLGGRHDPRHFLRGDIALGRRRDHKVAEGRREASRLSNFCFDFGASQPLVLALEFALHAGPVGAGSRPAKDVHSGLWLAASSVLLRSRVFPKTAPEVSTKIFEVLPVARSGQRK